MDDLETQLRTYADQVEAEVGSVPLPTRALDRPTSSQHSWLVAFAAALVLVVGVSFVLTRSGDEDPIDVAGEPDVRTTDTDPTDAGQSEGDLADVDLDQASLVEVPNVVGLDVLDARSRLAELGLAVEIQFEPSDNVPSDVVVAQSIAAGDVAELGAVIDLRVSAGIAAVLPSLVGETQEAAIEILDRLGYRIGIRVEPSLLEANTVIRQVPAPGEVLPLGEVVDLVVSGGSEVVPVPDVEGLEVAEAIAALVSAGFRLDTEPILESSVEVEQGRVLRTEPSANALVVTGATVRIVVSGDPSSPVVPDVRNLFADTAISVLRVHGFEVVTVFEVVPEGSESVGRVLDQLPNPATVADADLTVTIVVGESTPAEVVDVPQVTELFADAAITTLRNQGLEVATVFAQVPSDSVSIGRVLSQKPLAFTVVATGTVITITVGEAPPATTTTTAP